MHQCRIVRLPGEMVRLHELGRIGLTPRRAQRSRQNGLENFEQQRLPYPETETAAVARDAFERIGDATNPHGNLLWGIPTRALSEGRTR